MSETQIFTIEVDPKGGVEINLKGWEEESPKLAAIVEAVTGKPQIIKWNPKAHAHKINGVIVKHSH